MCISPPMMGGRGGGMGGGTDGGPMVMFCVNPAAFMMGQDGGTAEGGAPDTGAPDTGASEAGPSDSGSATDAGGG
jgi:hypothetical protein